MCGAGEQSLEIKKTTKHTVVVHGKVTEELLECTKSEPWDEGEI